MLRRSTRGIWATPCGPSLCIRQVGSKQENASKLPKPNANPSSCVWFLGRTPGHLNPMSTNTIVTKYVEVQLLRGDLWILCESDTSPSIISIQFPQRSSGLQRLRGRGLAHVAAGPGAQRQQQGPAAASEWPDEHRLGIRGCHTPADALAPAWGHERDGEDEAKWGANEVWTFGLRTERFWNIWSGGFFVWWKMIGSLQPSSQAVILAKCCFRLSPLAPAQIKQGQTMTSPGSLVYSVLEWCSKLSISEQVPATDGLKWSP